VMCPIHRRKTAWSRLVRDLPSESLEKITPGIISLGDVSKYAPELLAGKVQGRLVVGVRA
jgi:acrylyl-CoA reductase (NADPH)